MKKLATYFALVLALVGSINYGPGIYASVGKSLFNVNSNTPTSVPTNVTVPTITGPSPPQVGVGQLVASPGSWLNSPSSFSYQWNGNGTPISGAIGSAYTPVTGDVGHTLTVSVTARNVVGNSSPATSASTSAVITVSVPTNSTLPVISGASPPQVGSALTTSNGTWTNSPTGFTYQWAAGGTNITGATTSSFTPTATQLGATLTVTVTATNGAGSTPATSSATSAVVNPSVPVNSSLPTISGAAPPQVASTLSASTGVWTNSPTSFAYQWKGNGTNITGATLATYTPVTGDVGNTLTVTVTASNAGGAGTPATSTATAAVIANSGSVAYSLPSGEVMHFMAATGCSDGNSGTSTGSPWCTPNGHTLKCGDVIVAAPGDYSTSWSSGFSTSPSSCPSTSGGIDGTGGVYAMVVLCGGNVGTCHMTGTANAGNIVTMNANNIAIEGFMITSLNVGSTGMDGYNAQPCGSGTQQFHHVMVINDIAYHMQTGILQSECALNHNVPGNGVDYWAVVGSIAQNAANDEISVAAIDAVGTSNTDTIPGVHLFMGGNFSYAAQSTVAGSDIEDMMVDTADAHGYVGTVVIENNMLWAASRYGLQIFQQSYNSSALIYHIHNNTMYGNNQGVPYQFGGGGDFNVQLDGGFPWTIVSQNNIVQTNLATTTGNQPVYAMLTGGGQGPSGMTITTGGAGNQNIFKGLQTNCEGTSCDPGNNVVAFNGFPIGTNTYVSPAFANTTDLFANWKGAPTGCTAFVTTTACMGWNYASQTATTNTPIADLTPTAGGMAGKGYIPPGACAADADYPTWLKGIVVLQWNGTSLTENAGLVQKPCNL